MFKKDDSEIRINMLGSSFLRGLYCAVTRSVMVAHRDFQHSEMVTEQCGP